MRTMIETAEGKRAVVLMSGLGALWVILAIAREGVTYHLAPLIVAAVPTLAAADVSNAQRARLAVMGGAAALALTFLLASVGRMDGPSLLPFGGAAAEAVIFAVGGAFLGWLIGGLRSR